MVSEVFNFEIVGDRRCLKPRYVVYVMGQADYHMMDWRGCNFQRCKVPNQPKFNTLKEATEWAVAHFEEFRHQVDGINGSHVSDTDDKFDERVLVEGGSKTVRKGPADYFLNETGEMNEEEWEDYVVDTEG